MDARKRAIIVLTTITASIIELIDTSIVNVALSDISGNLGATITDTSWLITSYAIANVIIIPMTGFLAAFFGRKNYYLTSIIIFTTASFLCGQADSLGMLIVWRFVQGLGGGALLSTSQNILFDAFPPEKRGMASGLFGMGIVFGPTIGPTLGGIIVENYSWPLIFYINIPIGIAAALLTYFFVDRKEEELHIDRKAFDIDYTGILLLAVGIGSLQYVLERGKEDDWFDDRAILVLTFTAVIGLVGFVYRELNIKEPVVNLSVLKNRNLAVTNLLTFILGFGLFGSVFIFPVLVQRFLGYTPTDAGLGLVPGAMVAIFIMPFIGRALGKGVPPLYFVIVGFVCFILHGYTSAQANLDSSLWFFTVPQILRGVGTACLTVPLINQAVVGLSPKEMPSGIALTNMLRQLGGAFGIAMVNTYVSTRYAVHRLDLISNIDASNPIFTDRLNNTQQALASKGMSSMDAASTSYKLIDLAVDKQSYLLAYMDGFLLISVFFLLSFPFIFLLKTKKMTAKEVAEVSEHSH